MTIWSKPMVSPISRLAPQSSRPPLLLEVSNGSDTCVVRVVGELDLDTRDQLVSVSTTGHDAAMVIDLGGVTFMDCSGYGALTACRLAIEGSGRSVTIRGETGQPARLIELITALESADRDGAPPVWSPAVVDRTTPCAESPRSRASRSRRTVMSRRRS